MSLQGFLTKLEILQLRIRRLQTRDWLLSQEDQGELEALKRKRDALQDEISTYNEANRGLKQPLTEQDREVLLVMLDLRADKRKPVSRQDVADAIGGGDPQKITQHLREEGLVVGKPGVGVWLTEKGWKLTETLPRNTAN